jgi:hypothetical protein
LNSLAWWISSAGPSRCCPSEDIRADQAEAYGYINRALPDADLVLDVAINGNADAIVTNNTKQFREAAESFHLEMLTPAELLSKVRKRR